MGSVPSSASRRASRHWISVTSQGALVEKLVERLFNYSGDPLRHRLHRLALPVQQQALDADLRPVPTFAPTHRLDQLFQKPFEPRTHPGQLFLSHDRSEWKIIEVRNYLLNLILLDVKSPDHSRLPRCLRLITQCGVNHGMVVLLDCWRDCFQRRTRSRHDQPSWACLFDYTSNPYPHGLRRERI